MVDDRRGAWSRFRDPPSHHRRGLSRPPLDDIDGTAGRGYFRQTRPRRRQVRRLGSEQVGEPRAFVRVNRLRRAGLDRRQFARPHRHPFRQVADLPRPRRVVRRHSHGEPVAARHGGRGQRERTAIRRALRHREAVAIGRFRAGKRRAIVGGGQGEERWVGRRIAHRESLAVLRLGRRKGEAIGRRRKRRERDGSRFVGGRRLDGLGLGRLGMRGGGGSLRPRRRSVSAAPPHRRDLGHGARSLEQSLADHRFGNAGGQRAFGVIVFPGDGVL